MLTWINVLYCTNGQCDCQWGNNFKCGATYSFWVPPIYIYIHIYTDCIWYVRVSSRTVVVGSCITSDISHILTLKSYMQNWFWLIYHLLFFLSSCLKKVSQCCGNWYCLTGLLKCLYMYISESEPVWVSSQYSNHSSYHCPDIYLIKLPI